MGNVGYNFYSGVFRVSVNQFLCERAERKDFYVLVLYFMVCKNVVQKKLSDAGFEPNDSPLNPPHYVPKDSELVKTLLETYTDVTGEVREPLAIGGGTYVHHIENGVACGCADPSVDNHMHGPDEFVIIDQLVMSAEIFALAIVKLCGK